MRKDITQTHHGQGDELRQSPFGRQVEGLGLSGDRPLHDLSFGQIKGPKSQTTGHNREQESSHKQPRGGMALGIGCWNVIKAKGRQQDTTGLKELRQETDPVGIQRGNQGRCEDGRQGSQEIGPRAKPGNGPGRDLGMQVGIEDGPRCQDCAIE